LNGCTAEPPSDVRKLNGINVDSHHCVMGGKSHRSAASRGDTKDASARLERTKLNFSILIHASE
jgi:hypothetical protein